MKISPTRTAIAAALVALAGVGIPALGQDSPESLLPPGFDDPVPAPAPRATTAPLPSAPGAVTPAPAPGVPPGSAAPLPDASPTPVTSVIDKDGDGKTDADVVAKYELPEFAKRSLAQVGPSSPASDGLPANAFGTADGGFLQTLMRRMNAPVASRWLSIALRRALLSRVDTPRGLHGADFAAERAWLLIRMGEADGARAMVQSVDIENYTPKLFQVGMQAMLAAADPGGLCPMADPALRDAPDRNWRLAEAICAGLEGDPNKAGPLIDAARRRMGNEIDLLLAEKVVGMGVSGRRAVTIEWDGVDQLSAWRWGLAAASGTDIPDTLFGSAGPQLRYWRATSPAANVRGRVPYAEEAAAQGVFSSQALTDLYGEIEEQEDASTPEVAVARDLRTAFNAATARERVEQMRGLWEQEGAASGYARLILTARAAARIEPSAELAEDADRLIASMLSAGLDRSAMRWRNVAARGSEGWALLMLADPAKSRVGAGEVGAYGGQGAKAAMFAAAMAGIGRVSDADGLRVMGDAGVDLTANAWTRAIALAAQRNQPGTVVLLAATGMQTRTWAGVSPAALFHITRALSRVGLDGYARMIAVEAMTRS